MKNERISVECEEKVIIVEKKNKKEALKERMK